MGFLPSENSRASILLGYVNEYMTEAGDAITYDEVLGLIDVDRSEIKTPYVSQELSSLIATVNKRLHREGDWRHLVNEVGVGYRIGTPPEVRHEVVNRMRWVDRQQVSSLRAIEKVVRHPDATPGERKRAADAAASQAALLRLVRREQMKMRKAWVEEETSPVRPDDAPSE